MRRRKRACRCDQVFRTMALSRPQREPSPPVLVVLTRRRYGHERPARQEGRTWRSGPCARQRLRAVAVRLLHRQILAGIATSWFWEGTAFSRADNAFL